MNDNFDVFYNTVKSLATSQGFYSRLLSEIENNLENVKEYINNLDQKFKDPIDVVMFLES